MGWLWEAERTRTRCLESEREPPYSKDIVTVQKISLPERCLARVLAIFSGQLTGEVEPRWDRLEQLQENAQAAAECIL